MKKSYIFLIVIFLIILILIGAYREWMVWFCLTLENVDIQINETKFIEEYLKFLGTFILITFGYIFGNLLLKQNERAKHKKAILNIIHYFTKMKELIGQINNLGKEQLFQLKKDKDSESVELTLDRITYLLNKLLKRIELILENNEIILTDIFSIQFYNRYYNIKSEINFIKKRIPEKPNESEIEFINNLLKKVIEKLNEKS